ncbi:MAG: hypothetical protein HYW26_04460 [Candidatus Aenigmarchaeota archaeon]|nr:hypothetical protein [Candidatus Aenigmarchaeota archaeon]
MMDPLKFRELLRRIEWKNLALLAVAVALLAAYFKLFIITALIASVIAASLLVQKFQLRLFGFETVTFSTVIMGVAYGPVIGGIFGMAMVLVSLVISGYFGIYYLWIIPEYAVAAYLASQWYGGDILSVGLNITIILQVANIVLTYFFDRYSFFQHIVYSATNIVFNFAAFALFGPVLVGILK